MATNCDLLTEDEKARLRQEEIYRQEFRRNLEQKTGRDRAWEILNSNVCIWALTTIVVGLAAWGYAAWKEASDRRRDDENLVGKLTVELNARSFAFVDGLDDLRAKTKAIVQSSQDEPDPSLANELAELVREFDHADSPAYPEYRDRGLLSLLRQDREVRESLGQLRPLASSSRNNFLKAEQEYRELSTLVREARRDPRPSAIAARLEKIRDWFLQGGIGQVAYGPPEAPDDEEKDAAGLLR